MHRHVHPGQRTLLENISLTLDSGEILTIIGPNGAGKTNILEAVSLLSPGRGLRRAGADELIRRPEAINHPDFADALMAEFRSIASATVEGA